MRPRIPDGTHEVPPVLPRFPSVSSAMWGHMAGPKDEHECVEHIHPIKLNKIAVEYGKLATNSDFNLNDRELMGGSPWILMDSLVSKTWGRSPFCVMNFRWISGVPKSFKHPARCVSPKGL